MPSREQEQIEKLTSNILRIVAISKTYDSKTVNERVMKTMEELGELAQAILSVSKAPANSWRGKTDADVLEEELDVLQCIISVMVSNNHVKDLDRINGMLSFKLDCWEYKLGLREKPVKPEFLKRGTMTLKTMAAHFAFGLGMAIKGLVYGLFLWPMDFCAWGHYTVKNKQGHRFYMYKDMFCEDD